MNGQEKLSVLLREIKEGMTVLTKNEAFLAGFLEKEYHLLGQTHPSAIIIADAITNYYTCAETIFLRISRFFENTLQKNKWHSDLLYKMKLDIEDIRPAVVSERTYSLLAELMRFRHFKRYYFEFEYDWDRITFILKKYQQVTPCLKADLDNFSLFLRQVIDSSVSDLIH